MTWLGAYRSVGGIQNDDQKHGAMLALNAFSNRWNSAAASDVGRVRKLNEDSYLDRPDLALWAVADGMGGHSCGDVASQMVCNALGEMPPIQLLSAVVDFIDDSILSVNAELVELALTRGEGSVIGSTLVAMAARSNHAVCVWAGDSRLYRMRGGELSMLSEDHSLEHENGDLRYTESEQSNVITRAVGARDELFLDMDIFSIVDGDRFLLCSDGLIKELGGDEITQTLQSGTAETCSKVLVDQAVEAGGADNITAVVIDCQLGSNP